MQHLAQVASFYVAETVRAERLSSTVRDRVSLDLCKAVLENSDPLFIAQRDGTLIYANARYLGLFGNGPPMPVNDGLVPARPGLARRHLRFVEEVSRTREVRVSRELLQVAGRQRYFSSRQFPLFNENGEMVAVAASFSESTYEIEALGQSSAERQRLADIMRATSDWIWEIDAAGRITFVSDRIIDALGLPPAKLKGRLLFSIGKFPPNGERRNVAFSAFEARRPFRDAVVDIADANGDIRTFRLSGVPVFGQAGGFEGFRGAGNDITARVRAEALALRSQRALEETLEELTNKNAQLEVTAQRATAAKIAKEEFLATMSHELRTPLNAIIGFADLMKMAPFGPLGERYLDYVGEVQQAGGHLLSLINDCLDVARMEVDTLPIDVKTVPLKQVLRDARAMVQLRAKEKDIDLSETAYEGDIVVHVDPTRCFQIFVNLLSNGVKFTPNGGRLGIDVSPIDDDRVDVAVWDTGPGIPKEGQEKIFDKFQQLHDDVMTRANDGVGLGLTLSRQFARLMGGNVTVSSEPGKGSRFIARLRRTAPSPDAG